MLSLCMIKITLKVFGPLREILPPTATVLEFPAPLNGEELYAHLTARYPALGKWRPSVRLAVNLEYSDFSTTLNDNDEVGLIPPVSGG